MTNPANLKNSANTTWINVAALGDALNEYATLRVEYCKLRNVCEIRSTFNTLKVKFDCFKEMTKPAKGCASVSDLVEDDNGTLKMKANVFDTDVTPEKFWGKKKDIFRSLDNSILTGSDPVFIKLCKLIAKEWLDADNKVDSAVVSPDCLKEMKTEVDIVKADLATGTDVATKVKAIRDLKTENQDALFSDQETCKNFNTIAELDQLIPKISPDCYSELKGADKLAGLKTFYGVQEEVFGKFVVGDVNDPALWGSTSDRQLEKMASYTSPPSNDVYKTHPCSKLTDPTFNAKITPATRQKEIKNICKKLTKIDNSSVALRSVLGLTVFASILALLF